MQLSIKIGDEEFFPSIISDGENYAVVLRGFKRFESAHRYIEGLLMVPEVMKDKDLVKKILAHEERNDC